LKDLVLDVAVRAGSLIEDRLRPKVIYTRSTDVSSHSRAAPALANEKKADLFIFHPRQCFFGAEGVWG